MFEGSSEVRKRFEACEGGSGLWFRSVKNRQEGLVFGERMAGSVLCESG